MSSKSKTAATLDEAGPALVPKLRFPEFREAEGWRVKPFGELFTIGNGRDYKHLDAGDVPVYGSGGYMLSVNEYLYDGESVCIGRKGTINNPMFLSGRFWTVDTLFYTHSFKECLPKFIFAIFQQIDWLKHNEAGGVPSLSKTNIEKIKTAVPKPAEQQKIAECLNSVDELMAAQARKVDALKTHKKGLMQQLFPREGETQPRLRFPEFQNTGEWKPTSFGALGLDVSDGNYSSKYPSQSDFVANGVPFLRANNLKFGTVSDDDMRFISKEQHSQITKGHLKQGDILITTRGELGTVALVPARHIGSNINAQIVRINSGNKLVNTFLFQLLDYSRVIGLFDALSTGTALKQLPIGKLNQLALRIPEIREEQERIASCLSSLDALITAETQKLETLKIHKKGLMQQLFPSPEEVEA
ncbi:MAG: restriction endonuclease subunit S [Acidithiobacillus sp.]|nr:restriction endonuclease subunit S [Acidithiobacillus sp.]